MGGSYSIHNQRRRRGGGMTKDQAIKTIADKLLQSPWAEINKAIERAFNAGWKQYHRHPDASGPTRYEHVIKAVRCTLLNHGCRGGNAELIAGAIAQKINLAGK